MNTGSIQAGKPSLGSWVSYGLGTANRDMPAFRWYEKDSGRIMVSNRPKDAAEIEQRQSTGTGLLVDGDAYRVVRPPDAVGSARDGRFVDDRSGVPGLWWPID